MSAIRYYKGKYPVEILIKGKKHFKVKSFEPIPGISEQVFVTIPRLCWSNHAQPTRSQ